MSVLTPGFSERVFEFSSNAEYSGRNRAVLAGVPNIPTQNKEKVLGYDVAFELNRRGGAVHVIALQHKVPRYVDNRRSKNKHFWEAVGGPYFAFRLDTDQYNLIESIASAHPPGIEFYYCSPSFATRNEMNSHYMGKTVEINSVWIDVSNAGQIRDNMLPTIVYSADCGKAFRFSEDAVPLKITRDLERRASLRERRNTRFSEAGRIYETAFRILEDYWPERRRKKDVESDDGFRLPHKLPSRKEPTITNTASLLGRYFGLSVLVEVRT